MFGQQILKEKLNFGGFFYFVFRQDPNSDLNKTFGSCSEALGFIQIHF